MKKQYWRNKFIQNQVMFSLTQKQIKCLWQNLVLPKTNGCLEGSILSLCEYIKFDSKDIFKPPAKKKRKLNSLKSKITKN